MVQAEAVLKKCSGLHARPATYLVREASAFKSEIEIEYNGKSVNVRSLIGVLSLGVPGGSKLLIKATGEDESIAVNQIVNLIEKLQE